MSIFTKVSTKNETFLQKLNLKKTYWIYLSLIPPFALFTIFMLIPTLRTIYLSFLEYSFQNSSWVGLDNFKNIFSNPVFWKSLRNTFYYTAAIVPIGILISLFLTELIFPLGKKVQIFFKASFYLPAVASMVVIALLWRWIYHPVYGLINYFLGQIGIESIAWLQDTKTALISIIIMGLATGQGFNVILLSAAKGNIPMSLYECARLDGASWLQKFIKITIPLLKPTILYLFVVGTIGSFQIFTAIYMMTSGGPDYATSTVVFLVYKHAFHRFQFGHASAIAMVLFVIIFVISIVQFKWLSSDVEY